MRAGLVSAKSIGRKLKEGKGQRQSESTSRGSQDYKGPTQRFSHKHIYYPLESKVFFPGGGTYARTNLRRQPHCFRKLAHGAAVSWVAGTGPLTCQTGWQSLDPVLHKT